jgi:hypothetical protein
VNTVTERHAESAQTGERISAKGTPGDKIKVSSRRRIAGLAAYTISADGTPRKWGRPMLIDKGPGGLPVIVVNNEELLLDEVVAYAFLGRPPAPWQAMTVVHFDGDYWNCRVDNIRWQVCPEWADAEFERRARAMARPDNRRPTKQRTFFFS